MSHKILLVDDELTLLNTITAYLEKEGFTVKTAVDGLAALSVAQSFQPHLIILDIMLPGLDGLAVLQQLRQLGMDSYVLMLTAKADEMDKVIGLTVGADDYMTKPFSPRELMARVKAILRRGRGQVLVNPQLSFRQLQIKPEARQVYKNEQEIELTTIEFDLLHALARHQGRVLSREQLIEQVWGYDYYGDDRVVDVHMGRLRKKIEDDPAEPTLVVTVRGAGYRFEDAPL
ncbi:MAG TPA: response regulator transcription factor [Anaerolineae bacterium]|nr:response regulator transcription factor [Anaerolineae bacterium]